MLNNTFSGVGATGVYTIHTLNKKSDIMKSGTVALTTFTGSAVVAHTVGSVSTGPMVTPRNTNAGDASLYDVTLVTAATIPIGGKIRVTFPTGFGVATTAMTYPVGLDSSSTVAYSGNTVTITVVGTAITPIPLQPAVISFTLNGITNPGRYIANCV